MFLHFFSGLSRFAKAGASSARWVRIADLIFTRAGRALGAPNELSDFVKLDTHQLVK
jgi:hypothetical protein